MGTTSGNGYIIPSRLWAWAGNRRAVSGFIWLLAAFIAFHHIHQGRQWLANDADTPALLARPDSGGQGHTQIDFGGQWVMGRMIVLGHGRELYHRQQQWEVLREGFPVSAETPLQQDGSFLPYQKRSSPDGDSVHDADRMMFWFMGSDAPEWKVVGGAATAPLAANPLGNPIAAFALARAAEDALSPEIIAKVEKPAIGGPLYPPIHGFLYAPLGMLDHPRDAWRLFQFLSLGFALAAARGLSLLTQGRVWWSAAFVAVLLFPGCRDSIDLGQNPALSLCIAAWGWVLATRHREWWAGAVWGLFAFKPVWGMAFFLVPLLMGRWRICFSMVATGAGLAALTLPVVGLQTWFDWLKVGAEAAELYNRSENWINLSRDLQGIPRRFLHDFTLPDSERETTLAKIVAWTLWGVVFASTAIVYRLWADRNKRTGLGAAFLFLGAWLTCYRFMYYDVLLAMMGVACLFAEPRRLFPTRVFSLHFERQSIPDGHPIAPIPQEESRLGSRTLGYISSFPLTVIAGLFLLTNVVTSLGVEATIGVAAWGEKTTGADGATALAVPRLHAKSSLEYPWDTCLVLALWAWCGLRLTLGDEKRRLTSPPPSP